MKRVEECRINCELKTAKREQYDKDFEDFCALAHNDLEALTDEQDALLRRVQGMILSPLPLLL